MTALALSRPGLLTLLLSVHLLLWMRCAVPAVAAAASPAQSFKLQDHLATKVGSKQGLLHQAQTSTQTQRTARPCACATAAYACRHRTPTGCVHRAPRTCMNCQTPLATSPSSCGSSHGTAADGASLFGGGMLCRGGVFLFLWGGPVGEEGLVNKRMPRGVAVQQPRHDFAARLAGSSRWCTCAIHACIHACMHGCTRTSQNNTPAADLHFPGID